MRELAVILSVALAAFSPRAAAEPYETDPGLEARDDDYAAAKKAVEKKDWPEAVRLLQRAAVRHPDHADLQNMLGYSHRNLRQFEPAFRHYKRAIELEPRHRGAHEYIGETYLLVGDLGSAEKHLASLREICLLPCDELRALEQAIARHKAGR